MERWRLQIGSSPGSDDVFGTGNLSRTRTKIRVRRLPRDGRTLFVRLWHRTAGGWSFLDVTYVAATR